MLEKQEWCFYNNTLLIRNTQGLPKNVGVLKMLGNDRPIFQKNHSKRHWNLILLKKCTILPFWAYNTSSTAMLQHWLVKIIQFFSSFSSSSSCLCYCTAARNITTHRVCLLLSSMYTLPPFSRRAHSMCARCRNWALQNKAGKRSKTQRLNLDSILHHGLCT